MACSSSICVKEMVGPKGDHRLAGYLATYSQKTNSHLCDRLEAPYEIISAEEKEKKKREVVVPLIMIIGKCYGERPEI